MHLGTIRERKNEVATQTQPEQKTVGTQTNGFFRDFTFGAEVESEDEGDSAARSRTSDPAEGVVPRARRHTDGGMPQSHSASAGVGRRFTAFNLPSTLTFQDLDLHSGSISQNQSPLVRKISFAGGGGVPSHAILQSPKTPSVLPSPSFRRKSTIGKDFTCRFSAAATSRLTGFSVVDVANKNQLKNGQITVLQENGKSKIYLCGEDQSGTASIVELELGLDDVVIYGELDDELQVVLLAKRPQINSTALLKKFLTAITPPKNEVEQQKYLAACLNGHHIVCNATSLQTGSENQKSLELNSEELESLRFFPFVESNKDKQPLSRIIDKKEQQLSSMIETNIAENTSTAIQMSTWMVEISEQINSMESFPDQKTLQTMIDRLNIISLSKFANHHDDLLIIQSVGMKLLYQLLNLIANLPDEEQKKNNLLSIVRNFNSWYTKSNENVHAFMDMVESVHLTKLLPTVPLDNPIILDAKKIKPTTLSALLVELDYVHVLNVKPEFVKELLNDNDLLRFKFSHDPEEKTLTIRLNKHLCTNTPDLFQVTSLPDGILTHALFNFQSQAKTDQAKIDFISAIVKFNPLIANPIYALFEMIMGNKPGTRFIDLFLDYIFDETSPSEQSQNILEPLKNQEPKITTPEQLKGKLSELGINESSGESGEKMCGDKLVDTFREYLTTHPAADFGEFLEHKLDSGRSFLQTYTNEMFTTIKRSDKLNNLLTKDKEMVLKINTREALVEQMKSLGISERSPTNNEMRGVVLADKFSEYMEKNPDSNFYNFLTQKLDYPGIVDYNKIYIPSLLRVHIKSSISGNSLPLNFLSNQLDFLYESAILWLKKASSIFSGEGLDAFNTFLGRMCMVAKQVQDKDGMINIEIDYVTPSTTPPPGAEHCPLATIKMPENPQ